MAATVTIDLDSTTPVDLYDGLTADAEYTGQLTPDSQPILLYQTTSATAPNPRTVEKDKGYGTLFPGEGAAALLAFTPESGDYLWAWTRADGFYAAQSGKFTKGGGTARLGVQEA